MKRTICLILASITLLISVITCHPQDKPMPMSDDNIEKIDKEMAKAKNSFENTYAPSPSQNRAEVRDEFLAYNLKEIIEKKMGYNFDKTFRSLFCLKLNRMGASINTFYDYVFTNPKKSLEKGFISQRTFDIIDASIKANGHPLTDKDAEFLSFVTECQKQNGGICDDKSFLNVLLAHNIFPPNLANAPHDEFYLEALSNDLSERYLFGSNIEEYLIAPNGKNICIVGILGGYSCIDKFVVNLPKVEFARKYAMLIKEEKELLFKNDANK